MGVADGVADKELVDVGEAERRVALVEDGDDCAFEEGGGGGRRWGCGRWGGHGMAGEIDDDDDDNSETIDVWGPLTYEW